MSNAKLEQLDQLRVDDALPGSGRKIQTNWGTMPSSDSDSLKAGNRGPTLLEDFHFRDKISHFDHERIPERVVHARGVAAHGEFQVYASQENITKAKFLHDPSKKIPVFVRFSTVLGSKGAPETAREVRGFAVRWYTDQGNFDLVGNNIPVFFIQDAMKFPDLVHAGKPEPHNDIPQAASAHDNFWDWISLMPEAQHMTMWILSDRTIPRSYRMMHGFGVHSFVLVNDKGERRFVKFHWRPVLGAHGLVWDEAQKLGGQDPDFLRRDLYDAIDSGAYPEWELGIQVVEEKDEHSFEFDILDATKLIPEELVPVQYIGKLTLNKNVTDNFAETEMVAFCTQHLVPGIQSSDDPLLQGRHFSYQDTQLTRLGGPNWLELPINKPICPIFNMQRDGYGRQRINGGRINYHPNRAGCPSEASVEEGGFLHFAEKLAGIKERARGPKFQERYNQATLFYNSQTPAEKEHIIKAACFELGKCTDDGVVMKMLEHFNKIEPEIAKKVAEALGYPVPPPIPGWVNHGVVSLNLSMVRTANGNIKSRKIGFLIADGFCPKQHEQMKAALTSSGALVENVGIRRNRVVASNGAIMKAEHSFWTQKSTAFDAIYIPGGEQSIKTLMSNGDAIAYINEAFKHYKAIAASGDAVSFLQQKGHFTGVTFATGGEVVNSLAVITGNADQVLGTIASKAAAVVGASVAGAASGVSGGGGISGEFIKEIGKHRCWDRHVSLTPA
eukprot:TRINITY_DN911_c0_g1_i1.p1 TRINITY_DN911_c0_g1~~TRINITY_DN911_c0_g1_i1.p1  ORF type:complete len:727 (-),score=252.69 TRINITY_DN911_c0_g1_i1:79-2259(-)